MAAFFSIHLHGHDGLRRAARVGGRIGAGSRCFRARLGVSSVALSGRAVKSYGHRARALPVAESEAKFRNALGATNS